MARGKNVWFDLMTTDVEGAQRFYTEVIGWKTQPWGEADAKMAYSMWMAGDSGVGGVMALSPEARQMGAPPHWIAYTAVENVDQSFGQALELGAKPYVPPTDIPEVGRFAMLADPQGASFALFTPKPGSAQGEKSRYGQFNWAELNTTDYQAAWKFYQTLFGWSEAGSMDMGNGLGQYFMFQDADNDTKGGMSNMASVMKAPPHWLHYVRVEDLKSTLERVKRSGGKVMNGPMEVPGGDSVAQCQDPQGAFFALVAAKAQA